MRSEAFTNEKKVDIPLRVLSMLSQATDSDIEDNVVLAGKREASTP